MKIVRTPAAMLPVLAACFLWIPPVLGQPASTQVEGAAALSLDPNLFMDQYQPRTWWQEDGLPSNELTDIVQSPNGYLWVGTARGLARFDGIRLSVFDHSNTSEFVNDHVTALLATPEGVLWVGTARGGLLRYDTNRSRFQRFTGLEESFIRTLFQDRRGTLWIGTDRETWTLHDDHLTRMAGAPKAVLAICEDQTGAVWLGSSLWHKSSATRLHSPEQVDPGLYRYQMGGVRRITQADGFPKIDPDSSVTALCSDREGTLWIGTAGPSLLRYRKGDFEEYAKLHKMQIRHTHLLREDRGGSIWVGVSGSNLWRISNGKPNRTHTGWIDCLADDNEGGLWLGFSHHRGLRRLRNPDLIRASEHRGFPRIPASSLAMDSQGGVWIGTYAHGLLHVKNGMRRQILQANGAPLKDVVTLQPSKDGSLWVGCWQGLFRWANEKLTRYQPSDGLKSRFVRMLFEDSSGVVWIGFLGTGLQRLHGTKFSTVGELSEVQVNWIHEVNPQRFWIGTNGGLFQWDQGEIEQVDDPLFQRLPSANFTCHFVDSERNLWMAAQSGGLLHHKDGRFRQWTRNQGLRDDNIHVIQEDQKANLWLGGKHGFERIAKASLLKHDSARDVPIQSSLYTVGEGQWSARVTAEGSRKSCKAPDGSLWFATVAGVVIVPPDGPPANPATLPILVERVTGDGASLFAGGPFDVDAGTRRIEFHYTAPSFFNPGAIRFRHRLVGYEDDWREAGDQRWASYNDLPPGDYEFQVVADNGDGGWSNDAAIARFTVHPQWWETRWFGTLSTLVLAGGLGLVSWTRWRSVNQRTIQRRRHREELARAARVATMGELTAAIAHEVNQPLSAIVSSAQAAVRFLDMEHAELDKVRAALRGISSDGHRAAEVIARVRGMAETRVSSFELLNVNQVIRDVMGLFLLDRHRSRITPRLLFEESLPSVRGDRIQLQQVILNLLLNASHAVKQANAPIPEIIVRTSLEDGDHVRISVRDNGTGLKDEQINRLFEPLYTTKSQSMGLGLSICRTIVEAHKGRLWVTRNRGPGVTLQVSLLADKPDAD